MRERAKFDIVIGMRGIEFYHPNLPDNSDTDYSITLTRPFTIVQVNNKRSIVIQRDCQVEEEYKFTVTQRKDATWRLEYACGGTRPSFDYKIWFKLNKEMEEERKERLLSKAPELLAALKETRRFLHHPDYLGYDDEREVAEKIDRLIAEIEGEANA